MKSAFVSDPSFADAEQDRLAQPRRRRYFLSLGFADDTKTRKVPTIVGWTVPTPSARVAARERCVERAGRITALPSAPPDSSAFARSAGRSAADR